MLSSCALFVALCSLLCTQSAPVVVHSAGELAEALALQRPDIVIASDITGLSKQLSAQSEAISTLEQYPAFPEVRAASL